MHFSVCQVTLVLPVSKVHFDLTSLVVAVAQNAVVMETKGITRCLLSEVTKKDGSKELELKTEGINMHELFNHSEVSDNPQTFTCIEYLYSKNIISSCGYLCLYILWYTVLISDS